MRECRIRRALAIGLAAIMLAGAAHAASDRDSADCDQRADQERRIAGCTRIIQRPSESAGIRAAAYNNRGLAYAAKGDHDRAIADYNETMRLAPTAAQPHNNRGMAYAAKGDNDRAIADYSEAIRLDPKAAQPHNNRGMAYAAKGDNDRAIADFKKALELKPDYSEAREELSKLTVPVDGAKPIDAKTENWVDTGHHILIDVDSIHKGDDGLVYFNHQNKDPDSLPMERSFAFDCEKGLIYDSLFGPDWKSKGIPVTEGTPGEAWKTFVCSRVP